MHTVHVHTIHLYATAHFLLKHSFYCSFYMPFTLKNYPMCTCTCTPCSLYSHYLDAEVSEWFSSGVKGPLQLYIHVPYHDYILYKPLVTSTDNTLHASLHKIPLIVLITKNCQRLDPKPTPCQPNICSRITSQELQV